MKKIMGAGVRIGVVMAILVAAGTALAAASWTSYGTISNIEVDDTGTGTSTYLTFTTAPTRPTCGTSTQLIAAGSADNVKAMTATATAAFLAGRTVKVWLDWTCSGSYARFTGLAVQ
jgi:hypothetical protein